MSQTAKDTAEADEEEMNNKKTFDTITIPTTTTINGSSSSSSSKNPINTKNESYQRRTDFYLPSSWFYTHLYKEDKLLARLMPSTSDCDPIVKVSTTTPAATAGDVKVRRVVSSKCQSSSYSLSQPLMFISIFLVSFLSIVSAATLTHSASSSSILPSSFSSATSPSPSLSSLSSNPADETYSAFLSAYGEFQRQKKHQQQQINSEPNNPMKQLLSAYLLNQQLNGGIGGRTAFHSEASSLAAQQQQLEQMEKQQQEQLQAQKEAQTQSDLIDGLKKLIFQLETNQRQQQHQQQRQQRHSVNLNGKVNDAGEQQTGELIEPTGEAKVPPYSPTSSIYMRPMMEEPVKQTPATSVVTSPAASKPVEKEERIEPQPQVVNGGIVNINSEEKKFTAEKVLLPPKFSEQASGSDKQPQQSIPNKGSSGGNKKPSTKQVFAFPPPTTVNKSPKPPVVDKQMPAETSSKFEQPLLGESIEIHSQANSSPTLTSSAAQATLTDDLFTVLATISQRIHKLEDHLIYNSRPVLPKYSPPPSSNPVINLNPVLHNYFSLIKSQFLSIENKVESKFSNIEHKFSNTEIEDGIWKKTINWKMEEMSSKLSHNENKISFASDQIINKLELIERNFQIVTNDFFAKFLLVNDKLNEIEHSLQAKWADFEVKMRKSLDFQHRMTDLYKPEEQQQHTYHYTPTPPGGESTVASGYDMFSRPAPSSQTKESIRGTGPSNNNNNEKGLSSVLKQPRIPHLKFNNGTKLSEKFKLMQRYLKLINEQKLTTKSKSNSNDTAAAAAAALIDQLWKGNGQSPASSSTVNDENNPATVIGGGGGSPTQPESVKETPALSPTPKPSEKLHLSSENYRQLMSSVNETYLQSSTSNQQSQQSLQHQQQQQQQSSTSADENVLKCERLLKSYRFKRLNQEKLQAIIIECSRLLITSGDNVNEIDGLELVEVPQQQQQQAKPQQQQHSSAAVAEEEQIVIRQSNAQGGATKPTFDSLSKQPQQYQQPQQQQQQQSQQSTLNQQQQSFVDSGNPLAPENSQQPSSLASSKSTSKTSDAGRLEELDSKLQFYSTKIIKIVQEMWQSSQQSEAYLQETLDVANQTRSMFREELGRVHTALKPLGHLITLADEVREPLNIRIQELSSATNNSVEMILNTQAQFINSCRLSREEDEQVLEMIELVLGDIRNKTTLNLLALSHQIQEQHGMMATKVEGMQKHIEMTREHIIEGVRIESAKMFEAFKGDMIRFISMSMKQASLKSIFGLGGRERPESGSTTSTSSSSQNECFISKDEFDNLCESVGDIHQHQHQSPLKPSPPHSTETAQLISGIRKQSIMMPSILQKPAPQVNQPFLGASKAKEPIHQSQLTSQKQQQQPALTNFDNHGEDAIESVSGPVNSQTRGSKQQQIGENNSRESLRQEESPREQQEQLREQQQQQQDHQSTQLLDEPKSLASASGSMGGDTSADVGDGGSRDNDNTSGDATHLSSNEMNRGQETADGTSPDSGSSEESIDGGMASGNVGRIHQQSLPVGGHIAARETLDFGPLDNNTGMEIF